jgi:hypothetical protein
MFSWPEKGIAEMTQMGASARYLAMHSIQGMVWIQEESGENRRRRGPVSWTSCRGATRRFAGSIWRSMSRRDI